MRFEWFFIGYLLLFSIPVGEITLLPFLGYSLMLFAAFRLAHFENAFQKVKHLLFAAVPIGAFLLILQIYLTVAGRSDAFSGFNHLYRTVEWADELIEMAVMVFVYIGVKAMGAKADIPSLENHARRNLSFMLVYLVSEIAIALLSQLAPQVFDGFAAVRLYPFIIGIIWRLLNLWMLFTCYLGLARADESTAAPPKSAPPASPASPRRSPRKKRKHGKR